MPYDQNQGDKPTSMPNEPSFLSDSRRRPDEDKLHYYWENAFAPISFLILFILFILRTYLCKDGDPPLALLVVAVHDANSHLQATTKRR